MNNFFLIKKFIILLSLGVLIVTNANGATANCSNGECTFDYSNHYKFAKTHCLQTLSYEEVKTEILYFTILKNKQKCNVFESNNAN